MAILWQKKINNTLYEVRSAGRTRRLYTNNVCHSEYNPGKVITGSVWDLLMLPAFFYPPGEINRILVLGVGGGASLLQLHHLVMPKELIGVELNPIHLYIARRFFNADQACTMLIEGDAVTWLSQYKGEPFDLIIDDLFTEEKQRPVRAVVVDTEWMSLLQRNLTNTGALVINFVAQDELNNSAWARNPDPAWQIRSVFQMTTPTLYNTVGVFLRKVTDNRILRSNIMRNAKLEQGLRNKKLRYRITKLAFNH